MPTSSGDDNVVTRREIDQLIGVGSDAAARVSEASHAALERAENLREERWRGHDREHKLLAEAAETASDKDADAINTALAAVNLSDSRAREALRTALEDHHHEHAVHDEAHAREHQFSANALTTADESTKAALKAALDDHHREHEVHEHAHAREHTATEQALDKAEAATERRFESVNEFREQLRTQAGTFVSRDVIDALTKEMDRRFAEVSRLTQERYEANRTSITNIEKGDVKQEGKGIGQAWVIAAIVTAVTLASAVLGILIVVSNFATKGP